MESTITPPLKAACRCGKLQLSMDAPPLATCACHCAGCQKMAASAFSLTAIFAADSFSLSAGNPVIGGMHGGLRHYFCDYCLSWTYTRPDEFDGFVNVRTTMLEHAEDFPPFMETCTSEKLSWAHTGAVRSFEQFPGADELDVLFRDYAAWRVDDSRA
ncbi:GFA family protein [Hyphococcus sp.]|uniref:GFA family protein n=1 Tax=Hyphococcus sp. TaxID=2038636 RepID=UPI003CCBCAC4